MGRKRQFTFEERFWSKVDRRGPDECWNWLASTQGGGYGQFFLFKYRDEGRLCTLISVAHRVSWELLIDTIPEEMTLDHICLNRGCVNPRHLQVVTRAENSRLEAERKPKPIPTHCRNGHDLSVTGSIIKRTGRPKCRTCANDWAREWWKVRGREQRATRRAKSLRSESP